MQSEATKKQNQDLLEKYLSNPSVELRNELVMAYSYIAQTVAGQMRGITSSYAEVEDIVNNGIIALIDCIERFDPAKGVAFEAYAYSRIKCANIDFVRKQDWLPRRVRKTARDISDAYDELSNKFLRVPSVKELAEHMGVEEDHIYKHYREISNSVMLSFESLLMGVSEKTIEDAPVDTTLPESRLLRQELRQNLAEAIDSLSEKERLVISLCFYEHLKLSEAAEVMAVSEARVCQLRSRAIMKMREYMSDYIMG